VYTHLHGECQGVDDDQDEDAVLETTRRDHATLSVATGRITETDRQTDRDRELSGSVYPPSWRVSGC